MDLIKQAENLETKDCGYSDDETVKEAHGHRSNRAINDTDQSTNSINVTTEDDEELALGFQAENESTIVAPQWIGNIRCFWPNDKGVPRITIGPN